MSEEYEGIFEQGYITRKTATCAVVCKADIDKIGKSMQKLLDQKWNVAITITAERDVEDD